MKMSEYIKVIPMESEAIQMAYSKGAILFPTMADLLREVNEKRELSREAC